MLLKNHCQMACSNLYRKGTAHWETVSGLCCQNYPHRTHLTIS